MVRETNYFVQAFNAGKGGNLKADAPIACKSATGALRTAERLALSKLGVVAFSSTGDPEMGDYDDEPTVIRTAKGPLVTLPYTVELNDIGMMIIQHHESEYLARRAIDQFDRLYAEGKNRAKIMALAIHPYISGQPHRIKYLEAIYDYARRFSGVLHWNGAEILDWYLAATKDAKTHVAA